MFFKAALLFFSAAFRLRHLVQDHRRGEEVGHPVAGQRRLQRQEGVRKSSGSRKPRPEVQGPQTRPDHPGMRRVLGFWFLPKKSGCLVLGFSFKFMIVQ